MKITEVQKAMLNSLRCERLSKSYDNLFLVDNFVNTKGEGLVSTLQNEAFAEDEANLTAYYLIKDKDDNILFFFSLKCGLLYDQFPDNWHSSRN